MASSEGTQGIPAPAAVTTTAPDRPTLSDSFQKLRDSVAGDDPPADDPPAPEERQEEQEPPADEAGEQTGEDEGGQEEETQAGGEEEAGEQTEGEEGEEGEKEEAEEDEDTGDDDEVFKFTIPGRGPDDPDLELALEGLSKEQRDGLNRLRKGFMRGQHAREVLANAEKIRDEVKADRAELDEIEEAIRTDAAAFVQTHLRDRKAKTQIVLDHLVDLLDDSSEEASAEYDSIIEQLHQLEQDPVRRENYRLKRERARSKVPQRPSRGDKTSTDPEVQQVVDTVQSLIPAGADEEAASQFLEDALRAIHRDLVKRNVDTITPDEVKKIASRYLAANGLGPSAGGQQTEAPTGAGKDSAPAEKETPRARRVDPSETGKKLAERSRRRREAASTPAGGGAPPVAPPPLPKKAGVMDAIAQLKKNLAGG